MEKEIKEFLKIEKEWNQVRKRKMLEQLTLDNFEKFLGRFDSLLEDREIHHIMMSLKS